MRRKRCGGSPRGQAPSGEFFGWIRRWTTLVYSDAERGHHVWRGGSFNNNRRNARSSYRNNNQPDEQNQNLGFRVAGGCGTGVTAWCQSPAEESAGACDSTSGPRSRRGHLCVKQQQALVLGSARGQGRVIWGGGRS
ncbi:MAG: SUMF1/EgtB/PvdO family nonheme iron enzyme [Bryobacteraceae bacterium]